MSRPNPLSLNILTVSDHVVELLYSPHIKARFPAVDLILSCGDLPYYYLDYIISNLNRPLFFVRGNHANLVEYTDSGPRTAPLGGVDLHKRVVRHHGLTLAGIEGCIRYNQGNFQYTQGEMWTLVLGLVPALIYHRLRYGRYLDILVTHAPPWQINDQPDRAHQGVKAFRWLLKVFRPRFHMHGHIHLYRPDALSRSRYYDTWVINTYGYQEHQIEF